MACDNEAGFLRLYLDEQEHLRRYLLRYVTSSDAEDLVQETFLRAYCYQKKKTIRTPLAFLYRTARNLAVSLHRRHTVACIDTECDTDEIVITGQLTLEDRVESDQDFKSFCKAIARLPPRCRQVFVLKKVYGFSYSEIASELGTSERTVETQVAKGFKMCLTHINGSLPPRFKKSTESGPKSEVYAPKKQRRRGDE